MSNFFNISTKISNELLVENYSFTINWFALTYGEKMLYKNTSVKNKTCYNESLDIEVHFDIIMCEECIKVEFSDFYFYIRIGILTNLEISSVKGISRNISYFGRPKWLNSDEFLKEEFLIEINLTFVDKL